MSLRKMRCTPSEQTTTIIPLPLGRETIWPAQVRHLCPHWPAKQCGLSGFGGYRTVRDEGAYDQETSHFERQLPQLIKAHDHLKGRKEHG